MIVREVGQSKYGAEIVEARTEIAEIRYELSEDWFFRERSTDLKDLERQLSSED